MIAGAFVIGWFTYPKGSPFRVSRWGLGNVCLSSDPSTASTRTKLKAIKFSVHESPCWLLNEFVKRNLAAADS